MGIDVVLVGTFKGAVLSQASNHRISDQVGSGKVRLFDFYAIETLCAIGSEYAFIAEGMTASVQAHGIAHHHLADATNEVFGQIILLEGEIATVECQSVLGSSHCMLICFHSPALMEIA